MGDAGGDEAAGFLALPTMSIPPRSGSAPPKLQDQYLFAFPNYSPFFAHRLEETQQLEENNGTDKMRNHFSQVHQPQPFYHTPNLQHRIDIPRLEVNDFDYAEDIREPYSPSESPPPQRRASLPRNFQEDDLIWSQHANRNAPDPRASGRVFPNHGAQNTSNLKEWASTLARPVPKRLGPSVGSSEDFPFEERDLIPDLSSDSESVSNSVEDLTNILAHASLNGQPIPEALSKYLWETSDDGQTPLGQQQQQMQLLERQQQLLQHQQHARLHNRNVQFNTQQNHINEYDEEIIPQHHITEDDPIGVGPVGSFRRGSRGLEDETVVVESLAIGQALHQPIGHRKLTPQIQVSSPRQAGNGAGLSTTLLGTTTPSNGVSSPGVPCRYYAQGYCSRGNRCNFAHVDTAQGQAASTVPSLSATSSVGLYSPHSSPVSAVISPRSTPSTHHSPAAQVQNAITADPLSESWDPISSLSSIAPNLNSPSAASTLLELQQQQAKRINPGHRRSSSLPTSRVSPSLAPAHSSSAAAAAAAAASFFIGSPNLAGRYTSIEQVIGQIYPMCKDQHGCRFLQKKLDEGDPAVVDTIFNEVYPHFAELMTDPFGNYLCQKLLEHCGERQRLLLIESVAADLVRISQNMHGTRAVQKMIECLSDPNEIPLVIAGLRLSVVALIKDLNGNHVVQRCLNHLSPHDNQFIYDAVASHLVEVATHRHGCCVLQRCIDHATDKQKLQLVTEIAENALPLVKDPYGNYVVQYVLDLPYPGLINALISKFRTHLAELATQKFSSNVVEKCLTVGQASTRAWMIAELTESDQLKALIQDPFGNYVIQTAMNIADPQQHALLVEGIKPHLHALRNTPYGKRIQNKILKEGGKRRHHK